MNRKTQRRRQRSSKGGFTCPSTMSKRLCDKYTKIGVDPLHIVSQNFKWNLGMALRNRERRLMPEDQRVAEARNRFNYKSKRWASLPKNNSNITNSMVLNVHEATNSNFPANTGETPMAFVGLTNWVRPELNKTIRKKVYKNNQ